MIHQGIGWAVSTTHPLPSQSALPLLQWMEGKDCGCYLNGGSIPASLPCLHGPSAAGSSTRLPGGFASEELHPQRKVGCGHAWIPRVLTKIAIFSVQSLSWCVQKAKHSLIVSYSQEHVGGHPVTLPGMQLPYIHTCGTRAGGGSGSKSKRLNCRERLSSVPPLHLN